MKKLFIFIICILLHLPVYASDYSQSQVWVDGETITDTKLNVDIQGLIAVINDIDNDNVATDAAIANSKLNLTTVAQAMTSNGIFTVGGAIEFSDELQDIGTLTVGLNDLHFGSGGIINFDNTDITITHTANTLTFSDTTNTVNFNSVDMDNVDIDSGTINDITLDGAQIGGTTATGEIIVNDASDNADGLGVQGTAGQVLTSAGAGANPTFEDAPGNVRFLTTATGQAFTTVETVDFATEVYDTGADFASDTFTAPAAGFYLFYVGIDFSNTGGAGDIEVKIVFSTATDIVIGTSEHDTSTSQLTISGTVGQQLATSETVHITVAKSASGADYDSGGYFGGHVIQLD